MSDSKQPLSPSGQNILGTFTLAAQLPNQRTIQVMGYVFETESLESLNDRLDMFQESIERQRSRCEIPELEAKREQMIRGMEQIKEVLAELNDKQKSSGQLSSNERLALRNHQLNIKKLSEDIDKGAEAIAEAKRKAGFGG